MITPKKKSLPDPQKYDLIPPDMNYLYFENSEAFPHQRRFPSVARYLPVVGTIGCPPAGHALAIFDQWNSQG